MAKVSFPHVGYYSIATKNWIEQMGHEVVVPPYTNKKTVEIGVKIAPEFMCFPFKLSIGNMLQALEMGADTFVMFSSGGQCRLSYYALLQKRILKEYNRKIKFIVFGGKYGFRDIIKLAGSKTRLIDSFAFTYKKVKLIELTEDISWWYRPREIKKGETTRVMNECLDMIDKAGKNDLNKIKMKIKNKFKKVKINKNKEVLKIGVIGEIFTLLDQYGNQDIDISLGYMGAEVHKILRLSSFIKHITINKLTPHLPNKKTAEYIKDKIGGHGYYTVIDAIKCKNKGLDGVIHLLPFGCLPEVAVKPILDRLREDLNLPILSLSLDEHSGKAGLQTRLEAFVDLIKC